jgi:formylglycine-generating enzyme required for sulfatase activity
LKTTIKTCTYCKSPYETASTHVCFESPSGEAVATLPQPRFGMVIDKKYRLEGKLGEGGMGSVFRARRLFIDDFVAIKFVRPEVLINPEFRRRFYQEARVAARIKHPNVVTVHDFGETPDGLVYLVMEFLEGMSLGELLKKNGALALEHTIAIGLQICEALYCMHENNVIHRDLKPDNIMLIQDGKGFEVVKVVDFGVAKLLESNARLTRYQARIGSPVYCSPEQYLGEPVDHRTDLYGLGIVFYECLSGHVPFDAMNETELRAAILHKMPLRLDEKISGVSGHMAELVQWLLAKSPDDRPRHAAEVTKWLMSLRRAAKAQRVDLSPLRAAASLAEATAEKKVQEKKQWPPAETIRAQSQRSPEKKRAFGKPTAILLGFVVLASLLIWKILQIPAASMYISTIMASAKALVLNEKKPRLANRPVPVSPRTGEKENTPATAKPSATENAPNPGMINPTQASPSVASSAQPNLRSESTRPSVEPTVANRTAANNTSKNSGAAGRRPPKPEKRAPANRLLADKTSVSAKTGAPKTPVIPPGMVLVKETEFMRGDVFGDGNPNEKPAHRVRVASFLIGQYEVTNREYLTFVKATGANMPEWMNPASKYHYQTGADRFYQKLGPALYSLDHPVVGVSWQDAVKYCEWLSKQGPLKYRLPTEAEWELAARGGNNMIKYSWGNSTPLLALGGNVGDEALKKIFPDWPIIWRDYNDGYPYTAPVGKFGANAWRIYDVTGNVWEWCGDWYDENYYQKQEWDRPAGPTQGAEKAIRGGSWNDTPAKLRLSFRRSAPPTFRSNNLGFRVAASLQ